MAVAHSTKVWKLHIPPTEKLVLLVLCNHARTEDDVCWPGYERIMEHSGFCKKTVQRAIQRLAKVGLITVDKSKNYNRYTLYIAGDTASLNKYLKSPDVALLFGKKKQEKSKKDSKPTETLLGNNNKKSKGNVQSLAHNSLCAGDNQTPVEEQPTAGIDIKPIEIQTRMEVIWKNECKKVWGDKVPFKPKDRWNLEEFEHYLTKEEFPADRVLQVVLQNWPKFIEQVSQSVGKHLPAHLPKTDYVLKHFGVAAHMGITYLLSSDD